jgi:peptide/nickel transport system substrate-binding protein
MQVRWTVPLARPFDGQLGLGDEEIGGRMASKRIVSCVATAMILGVMSVGPALAKASPSAGASGSAASKATFTVGTLSTLKTINPIKALNDVEYEFLNLNYDLSLRFALNNLAASPGIVQSWTHSTDGMTWTYNLRSGLKWQDGQPMNAYDVAFTYDFMVTHKISAFSNYFPFTKSIVATSPTQVVWKTTQPTMAPQFPPWVYILPKHIWNGFSAAEARAYEHVPVIGSGPFQLVNWNKGQSWTFKANDNYWAGAPYIQTLIFEQFDNAEAMVTALKNGSIDFADSIPADLFKSLQNTSGISTNVAAPTTFDQLSFGEVPYGQKPPFCPSYDQPCSASTTNPALQNQEVRLALEYAIDKPALVSKALGGYGVPGTTIVPSGFPEYHYNPPASQQITFNLTKANQILDQAGYTLQNPSAQPSASNLRVDPNTHKPLIFRFYVLTSQPQEVKDAQYIQGWWASVGVKVNPQAVTEGKLLDYWTANDYDVYMWGWGPDPDPDFILSTFTTTQCLVWSDTCYSNPEYNALYQKQRTEIDPTVRKQTIDQMQQMIYKAVPEVVLYYNEDLQAYNSGWTGFVNQPQPQGFKLFAYSNESYLSLRPASATTNTSPSSGISGVVWLIAAAVIILLVGIVIALRRRGAEDRA